MSQTLPLCTAAAFVWGGRHDVEMVATSSEFATCSLSGSTVLAPSSLGGVYEYDVQAADSGKTLYFVCGIREHCALSMKIAIDVS